jgi:very-short-patch-repair endonuclease
MSRILSAADFIERAKSIHGDKYSYDRVDFKGMREPVEVYCNSCEESWFVAAYSHAKPNGTGNGCPNCKRISTEFFIQKAKEIHGDKYDYSRVICLNRSTPVLIYCKVHEHTWKTSFIRHVECKAGCKQCSAEELHKSTLYQRKLDFIKRARSIHGDKYSYDRVDFKGMREPVEVYCNSCEESWFVAAFSHAKPNGTGNGCPRCAGRLRTSQNFIDEARKIHGNKYDYSRVDFVNSTTPVRVYCPEHKYEWETTWGVHIKLKCGCALCGIDKKKRTGTLEVIEMFKSIHGDAFDYSEYQTWEGWHQTFKCYCKTHKLVFYPTPASHYYQGCGCTGCRADKTSLAQRKTNEEFIRQAAIVHDGFYDYSKCDYQGDANKITFICPKHGEQEQKASHHLQGHGCSKCHFKSEGRIAKFLHLNFITYRQFSINNRRFDFYLPDFNLIIERDGEQHYHGFHLLADDEKLESLEKNHQIDIEKTELAKQEGITICRLPYWLNFKEEIVETINIIHGKPTYPDVPDLGQTDTQPPPVIWDEIDYEGYVTTDENGEEDLDLLFDEDGQGSFDLEFEE